VHRRILATITSFQAPKALREKPRSSPAAKREIQALADAFTVVAIDGPDYRHREGTEFPPPATTDEVVAACEGPNAVCEQWGAVVDDLRHVHPSKLGAYVEGISLLGLQAVEPLSDQAQALRWVALVDRLYDRDVRIVTSGAPLDEIFTATMLAGGYRKKYLRALSRMRSMTAGE
jgi:cell division protein ZapE